MYLFLFFLKLLYIERNRYAHMYVKSTSNILYYADLVLFFESHTKNYISYKRGYV